MRYKITQAVEQARANPVTWEQMKGHAVNDNTFELKLKDRPNPETFKRPPSYCVEFVGGVRACISFEEQPAGMLRHLSVSLGENKPRMLPNPVLVEQIAEEFGMKMTEAVRMWVEEYEPGFSAVNLLTVEQMRPMHETKQ